MRDKDFPLMAAAFVSSRSDGRFRVEVCFGGWMFLDLVNTCT